MRSRFRNRRLIAASSTVIASRSVRAITARVPGHLVTGDSGGSVVRHDSGDVSEFGSRVDRQTSCREGEGGEPGGVAAQDVDGGGVEGLVAVHVVLRSVLLELLERSASQLPRLLPDRHPQSLPPDDSARDFVARWVASSL